MLNVQPANLHNIFSRLKAPQKASAKFIEELCLDFDLIDTWRIRNPEVKRFTGRQKTPFIIIQRRLDFWLISEVCQEDIERSDIISSINSDYSAIILYFSSISKQNWYGPSFWKFNASLTDDMNNVAFITESVPAWLAEFSAVTDKRILWDLGPVQTSCFCRAELNCN